MKNYEVTLMATSYKAVVICAHSEAEAINLAHNIYLQTDALDFNDSDVDEIEVQADEMEDDADDEPLPCHGDCMHCHDDRHIKCPMRCRIPDCDDLEYLHLQEKISECNREVHLAIDDFSRSVDALEAYYKKFASE